MLAFLKVLGRRSLETYLLRIKSFQSVIFSKTSRSNTSIKLPIKYKILSPFCGKLLDLNINTYGTLSIKEHLWSLSLSRFSSITSMFE